VFAARAFVYQVIESYNETYKVRRKTMKSTRTASRSRAIKLSGLAFVLSVLGIEGAHAEVFWAAGGRGYPLPANALLGGIDGAGPNTGTPLFVCRAIFADSVHPGKLIGGNCNISYGGREHEVAQYQVAVATRGAWGPAQRGYAGALVGGYEPGRTLFVCRARYEEPARRGPHERGLHPGKVVDGKCNFGWGGREIASHFDFEVFYPTAPSRDAREERRRPERDGDRGRDRRSN